MLELGSDHVRHYITISPGELTINHGMTFFVSDRTMQIREGTTQGVYFNDTRFLSHYRYRFNHLPPVLLTAAYVDYYSSLAHFTNPPLPLAEGSLPTNHLRLRVSRQLEAGLVLEELRMTNYAMEPVLFALVVEIKSDFADIFEIRGLYMPYRGTIETVWNPEDRTLINSYRHESFAAQMHYQIELCDSSPSYSNGELVFPIRLGPQEQWRAAITIGLHAGEASPPIKHAPTQLRSGQLESDQLHQRWHQLTTSIRAGAADIQRAIEGASEDLAAVRLYLPELPKDIWLPAAGVPWFVTVFGRDSEITSLQTLLHYPGFARATLQILGQLQGKRTDDWRLEEPGKIAHEMRYGQLAQLGKIPHTPYYGTIDATPLFVILLCEVWRWTGDRGLVERYLPHARAAITWIDTYGDHDGDGFLDYWRSVPHGLKNQGWKDSGNALVFEDGRQVPNPIAMVEFQGYVYDAKMRMAELEQAFENQERAEQLRTEAKQLQERFHQAFWMEQEGFFAFGLGPNRQIIRAIASNPGHALWSGIVYPELAARVVERLLADDMFSGWGIRTLSHNNPAFNPLDYQMGAVWPHDNAIIAHGCKRYGFADAANRIARAIFDVANYFQGQRLPELFGGFQRQEYSLPVLYPQANIPQAWAAGSVFQFLQAILGLEADAPNGRLLLNPTLPEWLPSVTIKNMAIGDALIDLHIEHSETGRPHITASRQRGNIEVIQQDEAILTT